MECGDLGCERQGEHIFDMSINAPAVVEETQSPLRNVNDVESQQANADRLETPRAHHEAGLTMRGSFR